MKVHVEDVSPIEKHLSIEVDSTAVEKELAQAYKQLSQQVKVPGFRPGKVPRRLLEQRFKSKVEADVAQRLRVTAYLDVLKERKFPAVGEPHLSGGVIELPQSFSFTARIEVKPQLTPKAYRGLALEKPALEVPDTQVDTALAHLRDKLAETEKIQRRTSAQLGDLARIGLRITKPFSNNPVNDITVMVAPGEFANGNLALLEGVTVGATRTFEYTFPADDHAAEMRGQVVNYVVTLKELLEKKVPAADDAFAKKIGMDSLEALKARIRKDLEQERRRTAMAQLRTGIFEKLIEENQFDVPEALVERSIDIMLNGAMGQMQRQGVDVRRQDLDVAKLRDELRPQALKEVRGQLLLEAIATAEKLDVSAADIHAELELIAQETGASRLEVQRKTQNARMQDALKLRALERKTLAFLQAHAKEAHPPPAA